MAVAATVSGRSLLYHRCRRDCCGGCCCCCCDCCCGGGCCLALLFFAGAGGEFRGGWRRHGWKLLGHVAVRVGVGAGSGLDVRDGVLLLLRMLGVVRRLADGRGHDGPRAPTATNARLNLVAEPTQSVRNDGAAHGGRGNMERGLRNKEQEHTAQTTHTRLDATRE